MTAWGIDISNHQAGADLSKAKAAGCAFVFAKATEGLTYTDDHFAGFRAQAKSLGLPFGAYHFARPQAGRTGDQEARAFLNVAGKPDGLPHVLDLEDTTLSSQATTGWALDWLTTVHKATGVRPIIYTYTAFAQGRLYPSTALAAYPLWLANYRTTPPPAPQPWSSWLVWQHTSSATVPGIPGRCDRNQAAPSFPTTVTAPQEDDMPTPAELWGYKAPGEDKDAYEYLRNVVADKAADLAVQRILGADVIPAPVKQDGNPTWTVGASLEWTGKGVVALQATVAALQSAVTALAEAKGADADAITKAVVAKIAALTINLDPKES